MNSAKMIGFFLLIAIPNCRGQYNAAMNSKKLAAYESPGQLKSTSRLIEQHRSSVMVDRVSDIAKPAIAPPCRSLLQAFWLFGLQRMQAIFRQAYRAGCAYSKLSAARPEMNANSRARLRARHRSSLLTKPHGFDGSRPALTPTPNEAPISG